MPEIRIQADRTAGIFRVIVDGKEIEPKYIMIKAMPNQDVKLYFGEGKGKKGKHKYLMSELYLNARKKSVRRGTYGVKKSGRSGK